MLWVSADRKRFDCIIEKDGVSLWQTFPFSRHYYDFFYYYHRLMRVRYENLRTKYDTFCDLFQLSSVSSQFTWLLVMEPRYSATSSASSTQPTYRKCSCLRAGLPCPTRTHARTHTETTSIVFNGGNILI